MKTTALVAGSLFLVFLIACLLLIPHSQGYKDCAAGQQATAAKAPLQEGLPIVLTCEATFIDQHNGIVAASATIVIAGFTLALWIATILLWETGEQQLTLARESSERQLRAYVTLKDAICHALVVGKKVTVHLPMKNSGQTPAYAVRIWVNVEILKISSDPDLAGPSHKDEDEESAGVVSSGLELHTPASSDDPLSQEDFDAIERGEKAVYVHGRIDYIDVFKRACFTDFRLRRSRSEIIAANQSAGLGVCLKGNITELSAHVERR